MKAYRTYIILLFLSGFSTQTYAQADNWKDFIVIQNQSKINTEYSEFAPCQWNEYIVYVGTNTKSNVIDKKTNDACFDIYFTAPTSNDELERSALISKIINTPYHEGPASFNAQGNEIYFTRVDFDGQKLNLNANNSVPLKIFESHIVNGEWSLPVKSSLNNSEDATCHPTLSQNGDVIVFASDRIEGYGKMDLYYCTKQPSGWSEPVNLGPDINTPYNEWFPYMSEKNYLFFASDGHEKGKDLNIYMSKFSMHSIGPPAKLPFPINTNYDDFSIVCDASGKTGYFSSNRPEGKGKDDLYKFVSKESIYSFEDKYYNRLKITVFDDALNMTLPNTTIKYRHLSKGETDSFDESIFQMEKNDYETLLTDDKGTAELKLFEGFTLIQAFYEGKEIWQKMVDDNAVQKDLYIVLKNKLSNGSEYLESDKNAKILLESHSLSVGSTLVFDNIFYDYNSYDIKEGAAKELDALAIIMAQNNNMKVLLSAHTDSRGDASFNQTLSERRAKSAKDYLVAKGIAPDNITVLGLGESEIRNHCLEGVKCSEAEHVFNRRTEVKILDR